MPVVPLLFIPEARNLMGVQQRPPLKRADPSRPDEPLRRAAPEPCSPIDRLPLFSCRGSLYGGQWGTLSFITFENEIVFSIIDKEPSNVKKQYSGLIGYIRGVRNLQIRDTVLMIGISIDVDRRSIL